MAYNNRASNGKISASVFAKALKEVAAKDGSFEDMVEHPDIVGCWAPPKKGETEEETMGRRVASLYQKLRNTIEAARKKGATEEQLRKIPRLRMKRNSGQGGRKATVSTVAAETLLEVFG